MTNIFSLQGRRALITGSSRGIGLAIAKGMAQHGAEVVLVARSPLDGVVESLRQTGAIAHGVQTDLSSASGRQLLWAELKQRDLLPDVLVNNAGIIRRHPITEMPMAEWNEVMETNLTAIFDLSQRFAKSVISANGSGRIINILSLLSYQGGIMVSGYAAAKSGLMGLTHAMANELGPQGINVNGIVPGYIATENTRPLREDAKRDASIRERIPLGRWGEPEDLQGAAIFLASAASSYVNGAAITVDGGWMSR